MIHPVTVGVDSEHPDDGERRRHVNADDPSAPTARVRRRIARLVMPGLAIMHAGNGVAGVRFCFTADFSLWQMLLDSNIDTHTRDRHAPS